MKKLTIWILVFILLVGTVSALGITPARQTINFEPGFEKEIVLKILNSDKKNVDISILVEGDLKEYIELNETKFRFSESDGDRYVSYKLKLPEKLEKYGLHKSSIKIHELPSEVNGELIIGTLIGVISEVHVHAPYPEKYIDADFNVLTEEGKAKLHIFVKSLGEIAIEDVKGTIIVEKDGEEIFRKESSLGELNKFDRTEMLEILKFDSGDYVATALVDYDGKIITFEKEFSIGTLINALGISVNPNFNLGDVAKFGILLENEHDTKVDNIIARLILKDENGNVVSDETSSSLELDPKTQDILNLYWDTEDIDVGSYGGKLLLSYNGKTIEKAVRINLFTDRIEASFESLTGLAVAEQPAKTDRVVLIPILIIAIIVINLGWIIYVRRRKK